MITKITHIESLSRFKNFSSSHSSLELGPANLFYAPNGRGKSTVADIVNSFVTNEPSILDKRVSKVYPGTAQVSLTHSTPLISSRFGSSKTWSNPLTGMNCLVFDKAFIQQNVHTTTIEHEHKKKMYTLLVGSSAIAAKEEVAKKRQILTDLQKTKNEIASQFARLGTRGVKIDEFVAMKAEDEAKLQGEREAVKKKFEAAGNPESIKTKLEPTHLTHPYSVTENLKIASTAVVYGGSKEAVELIKKHSTNHIHGTAIEQKEFLASSVKALGSKDATHCPTCGQSLLGNPEELIQALFTIFSNKYLQLRRLVLAEKESLERVNDIVATNTVQANTELNLTRHEEWKAYIEALPLLDDLLNFEQVTKELVTTKKDLINKLDEKYNDLSITAEVEITAYTAAVTNYSILVERYNATVTEINNRVRLYKSKLDVSQKVGLEKELINIDNKLLRASPNAQALAVDFRTNEPAVTNASTDLTTALKDFELAQKEVIAKHGAVINDVLKRSGAKFRITSIEQGKKLGSTEPYIEYGVKLIGGTDDAETRAGDAIGYILSDGEKNLLAFAFYWSLLIHSDLSITTAIFDDPLSSVDESWRFNLIELLQEISRNGLHQLFVLTHFMDFARVITQQFPTVKQLTIITAGASSGHKIEGCDIESIARELQYKRIDTLQEFIKDPRTSKPEIIQGEIRILLESALKSKYYLKLKPYIESRGWLRNFIDDASLQPILQANGSYAELSNLTTVSGYAHHENPPAYQFDEDQALTYAQLALDVLEKL